MRECCADHTNNSHTERCHGFMIPSGQRETAKFSVTGVSSSRRESSVPGVLRRPTRESVVMNGTNKIMRERSSSAPSIRLLPSQDIGKYEEPRRRRSAPERRPPGGGLFPLNEEGEYGDPPVRVTTPRPIPSPLTEYKKRDRKPKVYASYALSSECAVHSSKLAKNESDRGTTPSRRSSTSSRPSSAMSMSRPSSRASLPESLNRSLPLDFTERHIQFSSPHLFKKVSEKRENLGNDRRESIIFDQKRRPSVTTDYRRRDSVSSDYNNKRRDSVSSHHSYQSQHSQHEHEPYCELNLAARNGNNNIGNRKDGYNDDYKVDTKENKNDYKHKNGYTAFESAIKDNKNDYKHSNGYTAYSAVNSDAKENKNDSKRKNGFNAYSAVDSVTRDIKNFTNDVKTYNAFNSNKYRTPSFKKVSRNMLDSWISEDEEYEYENNENTGYTQKSASPQNQERKISLSAIREPTFDCDTLGILGLTSLMWSHSQAKQQDFLSKSFVRKSSYSSHVM